MVTLNSLPVELILKIINLTVPYNEHEPIIGVDAAWKQLDVFRESLKYAPPPEQDEEKKDMINSKPVSIYSDLLAFRLVSSRLNLLCIPTIYGALNLINDLKMPFEEFYSLIIVPYAQYFRTIRLSLSIISDEEASKFLKVAINVKAVGLYHPHFQPPTACEDEVQGSNWMRQTGEAIIYLLENHSLNSLGVYSEYVQYGDYWTSSYRGPYFILSHILQSPVTHSSLQYLDITLFQLDKNVYNIIRGELTSLKSLTINDALSLSLGYIWEPHQRKNWAYNSNLTRLQFKRGYRVDATLVHHLVRHFVSLKHLMISECGYREDDTSVPSLPNGWYKADDALWKVHEPLDTFWLEHMDYWEIGCMGEIPTKSLVVTNLHGAQLARALRQDSNYFPGLETIRIEPRDLSIEESKNRSVQFDTDSMEFLKDYCQVRGVTILDDAKRTTTTSVEFRHF